MTTASVFDSGEAELVIGAPPETACEHLMKQPLIVVVIMSFYYWERGKGMGESTGIAFWDKADPLRGHSVRR